MNLLWVLGYFRKIKSMMKFTFSPESSLNFIPFTISLLNQLHRVRWNKTRWEMLSIQKGKKKYNSKINVIINDVDWLSQNGQNLIPQHFIKSISK